jgi:hypothetical protein
LGAVFPDGRLGRFWVTHFDHDNGTQKTSIIRVLGSTKISSESSCSTARLFCRLVNFVSAPTRSEKMTSATILVPSSFSLRDLTSVEAGPLARATISENKITENLLAVGERHAALLSQFGLNPAESSSTHQAPALG